MLGLGTTQKIMLHQKHSSSQANFSRLRLVRAELDLAASLIQYKHQETKAKRERTLQPFKDSIQKVFGVYHQSEIDFGKCVACYILVDF